MPRASTILAAMLWAEAGPIHLTDTRSDAPSRGRIHRDTSGGSRTDTQLDTLPDAQPQPHSPRYFGPKPGRYSDPIPCPMYRSAATLAAMLRAESGSPNDRTATNSTDEHTLTSIHRRTAGNGYRLEATPGAAFAGNRHTASGRAAIADLAPPRAVVRIPTPSCAFPHAHRKPAQAVPAWHEKRSVRTGNGHGGIYRTAMRIRKKCPEISLERERVPRYFRIRSLSFRS